MAFKLGNREFYYSHVDVHGRKVYVVEQLDPKRCYQTNSRLKALIKLIGG